MINYHYLTDRGVARILVRGGEDRGNIGQNFIHEFNSSISAVRDQNFDGLNHFGGA